MITYQGKALEAFTVKSLDNIFRARFLLGDLHNYMTSRNDRKVCCLYRLRRTGKTIMALQEIRNLGDYENTLFIRCDDGDTMWQLRKEIDVALESNPNCRNIFIDEATKARNFIDTCSYLADDYAMRGIKVVLAGTDSLGFLVAKNEELFDRAHLLHTTYIQFKEYSYLLGKGIEEYIEYGGTLTDGIENVFYNNDNAELYTNSAIVGNISNTLKKWKDGDNQGYAILHDIIEHDDLASMVNKILEIHNHRFLAKIINDDFKSHDVGSLIQLMTKSKDRFASPEFIDTEAVKNRIREYLGIKEKHFRQIDDASVNTIVEYLKKLDVLYQIPKVPCLDMVKDNEFIFTQVGMRYCQATRQAEVLLASEEFENYTELQQKQILGKLKSDICGGILEDIISGQLAKEIELSCKQQGFKLNSVQFGKPYGISKYRDQIEQSSIEGKEIDILILDYNEQTILAIEVKLSDEQAAGQRKHLLDGELCLEIEEKTGMVIANKAVQGNAAGAAMPAADNGFWAASGFFK